MKKRLIFIFMVLLQCGGLLKGQIVNYVITDREHVKPLYDSMYTVDSKHREAGTFCIYTDSTFTHKVHSITYSDQKDRWGMRLIEDTVKYWYATGQIKKVEVFRLKNGRRVPFPSSQQFYRSGKTDYITYYPNDSLLVAKYFHESGAIKSIDTSTVDKSMQPRWRIHEEYCENGQRTQRQSMNSLNTAQFVMYDCQGNIIIRSAGNMYGPFGLFQRFYPNGQVEYEGNFDKTIGEFTDKTGTWTFYSPAGKKTKEEYYEKGKLIREVKFD